MAAAIAFLVIVYPSVRAPGATITPLGVQTGVNDQWRTTTLAKPLDSDGDNVYGTAGYAMYGGQGSVSLPTYISSATATSTYGGTAVGNAGYILMDDPTATPAAVVANVGTGTANPQPGVGVIGTALNITINPAAGTVPTFNITLLNDNLDGAAFNAGTLGIRGTGATTGDSGETTVASNDRVPDAYVFQISGAQPGDTFAVYGKGGTNGYVTVGIAAFDTVPEPASLGILAFGGLAMCARRRR